MLLLLSHVSIIYQRADNLGHPISQNFMVATSRGDLSCPTAQRDRMAVRADHLSIRK